MSTLQVTNVGLNLLRDALIGQLTGTEIDCRIAWVAIGTGTATPAATDTQLATEVFRKPVTSFANGTNPGEFIVTMYLSPSNSVGTVIGEVGIFAGTSATNVSNTGILIARGLYSHTHTNTESIQFALDITL